MGREGVLCSVGDGTVHMLSLPYLLPVWTHACGDGSGIVPTVLERNPERSLLWVGLEDGSFEAIVAKEEARGGQRAQFQAADSSESSSSRDATDIQFRVPFHSVESPRRSPSSTRKS